MIQPKDLPIPVHPEWEEGHLVASYNAQHDFLYLGKAQRGVFKNERGEWRGVKKIAKSYRAYVKPHPKGLLFVEKNGNFTTRRAVIPGECAFRDVVRHLGKTVDSFIFAGGHTEKRGVLTARDTAYLGEALATSAQRTRLFQIASTLRSSGLWARRGQMDPQKTLPQEFWRVFDLRDLSAGRHVNIEAWWRDTLTSSLNEAGYERGLRGWHERAALTKTAIERGLFPKRPTDIPGWERAPHGLLPKLVVAGLHLSPMWETYLDIAKDFPLEPLLAHPHFVAPGSEWAQTRDRGIAAMAQWPRDDDFRRFAAEHCRDQNFFGAIAELSVDEIASAIRKPGARATTPKPTATEIVRNLHSLPTKPTNNPGMRTSYVDGLPSPPQGWSWVSHIPRTLSHARTQILQCLNTHNRDLLGLGNEHLLIQEATNEVALLREPVEADETWAMQYCGNVPLEELRRIKAFVRSLDVTHGYSRERVAFMQQQRKNHEKNTSTRRSLSSKLQGSYPFNPRPQGSLRSLLSTSPIHKEEANLLDDLRFGRFGSSPYTIIDTLTSMDTLRAGRNR